MKKIQILSLLLPSLFFAQQEFSEIKIKSWSPTIYLQRSYQEGGFTQGIQTQLLDGTNNWYFGNLGTGEWRVSKGNWENSKFSIIENGNIGIGTANPQAKLDVIGGINISSEMPIQLNGSDISHGLKYKKNDSNDNSLLDGPFLYGWTGGSLGIKRGENEYNALYWKYNGNIGIGTNNPVSKLDIDLKNGGNGNAPIIRGNGSYISSGLRFIDDSYDQPGQIKEWAIWKGNTFSKGLSFMKYDAVNACQGGACDIALQLNDNGNVGIGNPSPQSKLDINGTMMVGGDVGNLDIVSLPNSLDMLKNTGKLAIGWNLSGGGGETDFIANRGRGNTGGFHFYDYTNEGQRKKLLVLNNNGNALIEGKLEAKEIKVTTTPTADFVFEDSYQLPDLESVEKHIKEKKHLPEIASAAEMQKDGVNIGDFQIKLLQKIEELTLYQIQLNKEVTNLKQENIQLKETLQKIQNHEKSY
nr:hypothetical protein [Elizabethkingia sp. ASV34]